MIPLPSPSSRGPRETIHFALNGSLSYKNRDALSGRRLFTPSNALPLNNHKLIIGNRFTTVRGRATKMAALFPRREQRDEKPRSRRRSPGRREIFPRGRPEIPRPFPSHRRDPSAGNAETVLTPWLNIIQVYCWNSPQVFRYKVFKVKIHHSILLFWWTDVLSVHFMLHYIFIIFFCITGFYSFFRGSLILKEYVGVSYFYLSLFLVNIFVHSLQVFSLSFFDLDRLTPFNRFFVFLVDSYALMTFVFGSLTTSCHLFRRCSLRRMVLLSRPVIFARAYTHTHTHTRSRKLTGKLTPWNPSVENALFGSASVDRAWRLTDNGDESLTLIFSILHSIIVLHPVHLVDSRATDQIMIQLSIF